MPLIEGVGDEVTVGCSVFLLLCLVLLAWFSTHTPDIPFISIIVVELSQRRNRLRNNGQQPHNSEEGQQLRNSSTDNETSGERAVSLNNNAQTDNVGGQEPDSASASNSKNSPSGAVLPHTDSNTSSQQNVRDIGMVGLSAIANSDSAEQDTQLEKTDQVSGAEAAEVDKNIPDVKPEDKSSVEVRRRRVAYFECARDSDNNKAEVESVGAESEQSSLGPQDLEENICDGHSGNAERILAPLGLVSSNIPSDKTATTRDLSLQNSDGVTLQSFSEENSKSVSPNLPSDETVSPENDVGGQQIRVRLKYLNDTQRLVYTDPQETIGNFRRLHFSSELEDNKIVRFIFNGQDLRNDLSTLRAYNVADNSVIHCLITQNRQNEQPSNTDIGTEEDDTQMGEFIYPIFGLILGLVWYLRFTYKQYFNAMSTVSLAGVSFMYILALFSSFRRRRRPHLHLD